MVQDFEHSTFMTFSVFEKKIGSINLVALISHCSPTDIRYEGCPEDNAHYFLSVSIYFEIIKIMKMMVWPHTAFSG